ncbi:MAG: hypothetical protein IKT32_02320, partial [Clostridia bacterium]|nr:hypothetical protein [Clostridia bacterium]
VENVNIERTSYSEGACVISMSAYTLWKDSGATTHHGGAQLENVNVIVNVQSAVTLSGDGGTYFCIVAGDVADCKKQFINNYFVANGKITATNLWSSNTSSAGKAIKDRFDAAGNSNYFINEVSTASDAVVDANAKTLTLKIAGSEATSAVAVVNGKAVNASVEGESVTLSGIELAESYNVTVYAGGKCYTVTVNA